MRVNHHGDSPRSSVLTNPGEVIGHGAPVLLSHLGSGSVITIQSRFRCQDKHLRVRGNIGVKLRGDRGQRVKPWVVQDDGEKPSHRTHVVFGQCCLSAFGVLGKKTQRAKLHGFQTQCCHLGQHAIGTHLVSPSGNFTHTPGNGCSGDTNGAHASLLGVLWVRG